MVADPDATFLVTIELIWECNVAQRPVLQGGRELHDGGDASGSRILET